MGWDLRCWWDEGCRKSYYIWKPRLCQWDIKSMLCKWTRKPMLCKLFPKQMLRNMKDLVFFVSFQYLFVLFYTCTSICLYVSLHATCMAHRSQKRTQYLLELIMNNNLPLGLEPGSSSRAISLALIMSLVWSCSHILGSRINYICTL